MRKYLDIHPKDGALFKQQICQASRNEGVAVVLDSNDFEAQACVSDLQGYDFVAGLQSVSECTNRIERLKAYHDVHQDWMLGFLSYDLKNQLEELESNHPDRIEFPEMYFFQPRYLFLKKNDQWQVAYLDEYDNADSVRSFVQDFSALDFSELDMGDVKLNHQVSHKEYLEAIEKVLWHIQRGDIYELNYCMEFFIQDIKLTPQSIYQRLREVSPTPFSAFIKYHDKFLMGASPERYMKKEGQKLVSQPIKGTSPRDRNPFVDKANKRYLTNSKKEQAENIMITDLVRNDLSKVAQRGSVNVDELCGIYSFKQVHQMISTVSAHLRSDKTWYDAIVATFPMGSMTGAPKVSAMQLIEKYENSKRGLYSGALGYVTPNGDFDFNVVIRSILYNRKKQCASFTVGGAITNQSVPQSEYDECLLKASAIMKVFKINN